MSTANHITLTRQGPIAIVEIDRPAKRNAFTQKMLIELTHIADELCEDANVFGVVVTGSKTCFSAGIDLKDPDRWNVETLSVREQRQVMQRGRNLAAKWEALPQITIAAIEGYAIGAGMAFAMNCDWRVIADDAYFWLPEIQYGISLGWGALPRLVNLVGPAKAKQLIILCERIFAQEASTFGLVDWMAPKGGAFECAMGYARRVADLPAAPVMMTKEAVNACAGTMTAIASYMEPDQANFLRTQKARRQSS